MNESKDQGMRLLEARVGAQARLGFVVCGALLLAACISDLQPDGSIEERGARDATRSNPGRGGSGGGDGSGSGTLSGGSAGIGAEVDPTTQPQWYGAIGKWCGPKDDQTLWLTAAPATQDCKTEASQIYGDKPSDGFAVALDAQMLQGLPRTISVPVRRCKASVCTSTEASIKLDSYQEGTSAALSFSLQLPDGSSDSGILNAGWCNWDESLPPHPEGERLARNISLTEVAFYQAVKSSIMKDMKDVTERTADLVAGRAALVRVFFAPQSGFQARSIAARLTLIEAGKAPTVLEKTLEISSGASSDAALDSTFNFDVPADAITTNTHYKVELRELGACTALEGTASNARFPDTGDLALRARETGAAKVMFIPIRYNADGSGRLPDTSEEQLTRYRKILEAMYPLTKVEFSVHEPVSTTQTNLGGMLNQVQALRSNEEPPADLNYYGLVRPAETFREYCAGSCTTGIAGFAPSRAQGGSGMGIGFTGETSAGTFAHELGHVHRIQHAPCGGADNPDESFPDSSGGIIEWGYDNRTQKLIDPQGGRSGIKDFMSYCDPSWISAYNYQKILDRIAVVNRVEANLVIGEPTTWRTLIVDAKAGARWGLSIRRLRAPDGDPELALIRDHGGAIVESIRVYRTEVPDFGAVYWIPESQPGWHSVEVAGATPHAFSAPSTVTPFDP